MEKCSTIQTLRKPKLFNMSIFDWVTSLLGAVLLGLFFRIKKSVDWALFIVAWTLFGILTHLVFGVNTQLGYYLGLNPAPVRKECL
jgi:hypothetical protein